MFAFSKGRGGVLWRERGLEREILEGTTSF